MLDQPHTKAKSINRPVIFDLGQGGGGLRRQQDEEGGGDMAMNVVRRKTLWRTLSWKYWAMPTDRRYWWPCCRHTNRG